MSMSDHDFRKRMTVANHLTEGFEPKRTQKIKELLVEEYLKGRTTIYRNMFDKIRSFLQIESFMTLMDKINEEERAKLLPLKMELTSYKATMVFLKTGIEFKPLFIRANGGKDITEEATNDKEYSKFLEKFYETYVIYEKGTYYVTAPAWTLLRKKHKDFKNRLVAEEKLYYTEQGVYELEKAIREIKRRTVHTVEKLSEEEKERIVRFWISGGQQIDVLDVR